MIPIYSIDAADRHWEEVVRNWLEPARAKSIAEYLREGEDAFWEAAFSEWEEILAAQGGDDDPYDPSPRKAADLAVRMVREWIAEDRHIDTRDSLIPASMPPAMGFAVWPRLSWVVPVSAKSLEAKMEPEIIQPVETAEILRLAVGVSGGARRLAERLGISESLVSMWRSGARAVGDRYVEELIAIAHHASCGETARRCMASPLMTAAWRERATLPWAAWSSRLRPERMRRQVDAAIEFPESRADLVCAGIEALLLAPVLPEWSAETVRVLDHIRV